MIGLPRPTAPQWIGVGLIWLGGIAAIRFLFGLSALEQAIPGFSEMGLVAPMLLLASGTASLLLGAAHKGVLGPWSRWVVRACVALLAVFPALMLVEHMAGVSLGVDFVRAGVQPTPTNPFPGRMSPNACVAFGLAGLAIQMMLLPATALRHRVALGLIFGVAFIGAAGCIGYVLHFERLYRLGAANRLVLPVAYGLTLLSIGLWLLRERWAAELCISFQRHEQRIGQRFIAVLGAVSVAAGVGGFAVTQQAYEQSQADGLLLTATTNADALANTLEVSAWYPRTVATRPVVGQSLDELRSNPNDPQHIARLQRVGRDFLTAGVSGVRFENSAGAEVVTVGQLTVKPNDPELALSPAFAGSKLVWKGGYILHSQHPVVAQGQEVGRITVEQPLPLFDKLVANVRRMNDSSDALVCNRVGDVASCVPSRFYEAPFTIPMLNANGKPNYPINRALLGESGVLVTKDLRGISVVAAYTPIAATGLGLVVKLNTDAMYAPLRDRLNILAALLIGLMVVGWWVLRSQVRPLVAQIASEQRRTRAILENSNDAFLAMGEDGRITDWNSEAQRTFGWTAAEALGQKLSELIIPADQRDAHNAGFARFKRSGSGPIVNRRIEVAAQHRSGHTFMAELSVASLQEGSNYTAHAFMRDITQRLAAQREIANSEKHLRDIADNLPVLIGYIGNERKLVFANQTFKQWMGLDPDTIKGKSVAALGTSIYEERSDLLAASLAGKRVEYESVVDALGVVRTLHTVLVPDVQADGRVAGVYALSTDVSANKAAEQHLHELARVDALTGLPNRRQFEERLKQAMARTSRTHRPMALIFMDIDHFKAINDSLGHVAGDEVLKEFGVRLQESIRLTDLAARLAGDEFVVILEGLNTADEASVVAAKLVEAIRQPMRLMGQPLPLDVTASMGLAYYEGRAGSAEALIERADRALYRAKAAGRNTFAATVV